MRYIATQLMSVAYNSHVMRADFSKLKAALAKAGMNQSELARRIGVERAAVSKWVTGRATPTLENLQKAAQVLGMSISEILGDEVLLAETKTERDILKALRSMSQEDREALERMAKLYADHTDD